MTQNEAICEIDRANMDVNVDEAGVASSMKVYVSSWPLLEIIHP